MRPAVAALPAALLLSAIPSAQSADARVASTIERTFAAGGQIRMNLAAGEYEIVGSPAGRIRVEATVRYADQLRDVRNQLDVRGGTARLTTDGPSHGGFNVMIEVPARSDLVVRLTAGELAVKGIEGNKDIELHAGELDIDVDRPDDYRHVDAGVWAGEIHAVPYRISKEGLFRSFDWNGSGRYRLHAHLKAGELRLHASSSAK
jgi:hypothetical protein